MTVLHGSMAVGPYRSFLKLGTSGSQN